MRSLQTSGPLWDRWTGRPTTACCKVRAQHPLCLLPPRSQPVWGRKKNKSSAVCVSDPGKYNFTPRLFHLSAASGSFQARELQSPARLPGLVTAMPFVQESLFSAPQPGESAPSTPNTTHQSVWAFFIHTSNKTSSAEVLKAAPRTVVVLHTRLSVFCSFR